MLGIHEGAFLEKRFPGTTYIRYDPREVFPFSDNEFDVCYCNAVIEQVGRAEDRRRFLGEVLRVGKKVFLTTPNRWYPVDFHKMIPLLHWLPQNWYRAMLGMMGDTFYSYEENLNLLSKRELGRLFTDVGVPFRIIPYRFMGFVSNLLVIAK
jgi:ubiquinone/menaquinone biosynthesis C-methylase UbiE